MADGQRLRVGHVQRGGDPPGRNSASRAMVSTSCRGHVDKQRAVRQQTELPRHEQPLGLRRVRAGRTPRQPRAATGQVTDRVDKRRPGPAALDTRVTEGTRSPAGGPRWPRTMCQYPTNQHSLVGQRPAVAWSPPTCRWLVARETSQVPAAGQGQRPTTVRRCSMSDKTQRCTSVTRYGSQQGERPRTRP